MCTIYTGRLLIEHMYIDNVNMHHSTRIIIYCLIPSHDNTYICVYMYINTHSQRNRDQLISSAARAFGRDLGWSSGTSLIRIFGYFCSPFLLLIPRWMCCEPDLFVFRLAYTRIRGLVCSVHRRFYSFRFCFFWFIGRVWAFSAAGHHDVWLQHLGYG